MPKCNKGKARHVKSKNANSNRIRIWGIASPILLVLLLGTGCPSKAIDPTPEVAAKALGDTTFVNAGGGSFVDSSGNTWLADVNYNTGNTFSTSNAISGSADGQPYQSERWDSETGQELMYSFPLTPGEYTVRLHFAEIYSGTQQVGQRVFDVLIEGQTVLDNFDMVADSGYLTAIVKEFNVTLVDGTLNIQLLHVVENPKISGIEIIEGPVTFPVLDASPTSIDFGSIQVGNASAGQTVTLANTGDDVLNVSGVSIQGANASDFSSDAAAGYTIDPGLSATFDVTFGPLDVGARSASLVITSDDANSPATIPLSGQGLAAVANVSQTSINFGSVFTGATSSATNVSITNDGNQTLNVSSISLGGTNPGDFGSTAAATYTIAPGASESFDVTFSPSAGGARSAELSIVSNDPASPAAVTLSGTGVVPQPPTANVSPVAIDFETVTVSTTSAGQSVMISNTGDQTLEVSSVSASGDFATDASPPYSIAPGNSVSFNVTFTPASEGPLGGQVTVTSNDPSSPAAVLLSGQGQQPQPPTAVLNPASNDFGTVRMPQSSSPLAVVLSNTGDDVLEVSSVGITGANAGDFSTNAAATYSIPVGQSVGFTITFTPTATGTRTATLSVISNDPNSPAGLSLSGTGEDPFPPDAQVAPLSLSFGTISLPETSAGQTVSITNGGEQTLNVSGISFSGANPGDFGTNAAPTYAIAPTESVNFDVTFTPTAEGARTASLVIASDDPDGSVLVALDGTGFEPPKASVTPTAHDFGQIVVTTSSGAQTFTVENIDSQAHTLTGITLNGANPGDFGLSGEPSLPLPMNPNDTTTIDAVFSPTTAGARTADVVFEFDGGAFSVIASLSGTGVTSVPTAFFRLNTGGSTYVDGSGNTWVSDNPYRNTGSNYSVSAPIAGTTEDTLYQSERYDGSSAPELIYTLPLDPGEYTVRLHFAEIFSGAASVGARVFNVNVEGNPFLQNFDIFATAGFQTATIQETTVQVNDGNLNIEFVHVTENPKISAIEVLGDVVGAPVLSATPTSIDFGQVDVGVQSAPTTVTLSNVGAVTLQVSGIQITNPTGGTFATNALSAYSIAPSTSVTFDVTLTPDGAGVQSATLSIASNDASSPASISLTGEGVATGGPQVSIAPQSVTFGAVDIGSSSAPTTVTITNDDTVSHTLDSISVGGAQPGDFPASGMPAMPMALAAGQSASANITFTPSATGARNAQVTFSLDGGAITPSASLSGTGQNAPPPPPTGAAAYRINVGGGAYTDTLGNEWSADQNFNTGSTFTNNTAIGGTNDDTLYQSERWDGGSAPELIYSLPVANGSYDVRLHFAEIYNGITAPGQRVFSILLEGQPAISNYDIFAAAGYLTADVLSLPVTVSDGNLDIEFVHGTENPKVNAIEVLTASGLESDVSLIEWGHVGVGATGDVVNVTLTNSGDVDATISSLAFNINAGVGHDFHATLGGTSYAGGEVDVQHATNVTVPVGQSIVVPVQFLPTESVDNDVNLVFGGNFGSIIVRLAGTGGEEGGHPFLHVVIVADPYVVDFDGNGSEPVNLVGAFSHTHQIGHSIVGFEWTEGGTPFSTQPDPVTAFPVGDHTVTLTITDDNVPAETLSGSETFSVVAPDAIPGVLAQYYTAGGIGGANVYLDTVPSNPEFAEALPNGYEVLNQSGTIGGSSFATFVMVQMLGSIQIDSAGQYAFLASGGNESRLFLNGSLHTGPEALTPGLYSLEARFAVNSVSELPLTVTYAIDGGAQMPIDPLMVVHNEAAMKPVINSMPNSGLEVGGAIINIQGLGFIPLDQVTVHWGGIDFSGTDLTVTSTQVTLTSPPGVNTVQVTVETPNGVSNPMSYTYNATGPAPVQFDISDMITGLTDPTAATIGADGRLYVSELDGTIFAYTFDENYNVTDTQTITTLEAVSNMHIIGLETNPFDPPGVVRIYVGHSQLFANDATCFEGFSPYSGQVSILTGPNFDTIEPVATGLPVSNHDHGISGMAFDDNGDLYVCVGGNTNAGVLGCNLGGLDESPLSGSIVRLKLSQSDYNGTVIYRDPLTCVENDDQVFGDSVVLAPGIDIEVFAPGIRNSMDIEYTTKGRLYATDNGPNAGFGVSSTGPNTQGPEPTFGDELNLIDIGRYYGHPNRNRGREDFRQNIYHDRTVASIPGEYEGTVAHFQASTNGIIEYRSQTFNDAMRGDLLAQRWDGTTSRITLSADGKSTTNMYNIFNTMTALNLFGGPGGVILGIDLSSGLVSKAMPNDIAAGGLTVYDIFPWRAPTTGGQEFTISGVNFGNIGNTTVTIAGKSATVTSVTGKRIKGIIPSSSVGAGPDMQDIVVSVGPASVTMPNAFRYLRAPGEDSGSRAMMNINPGGSMAESSTYGYGSFNLANQSTNGQKITRMRLDIEKAIMPDSVFDPYGLAGDPVGKDFTLDNGNVGVTSHTWFNPNGGGFDVLEVEFNDFDPGETLRFSADIDPTSVKGAPQPGPNDSASISGMDLTGSKVRVEFDDGTVLEGTIFRTPGSATGAQGTFMAHSLAPPEAEIEVVGVCSPSVLSNANQTVTVYGPQGYDVRLLVVESALYLQGVPGGGYDIDPFEYNTAVSITEYAGTIGGSGTANIPVTLTNSGTDAGYNVITAVLVDAQGNEGPTSETLVLQLN